MLSQVNYRVPNMRFLRERLTVSVGPLRAPPLALGTLGGLLPAFEQKLVVVKLPRHVCILQRLPAFPGRAPTHGSD